MQSDIEVMRYITGKTTSYEESLEKLKSWIDRYETKTFGWPYAIELKGTNEFVGVCGIIEDNEIGYRFLQSVWGRGYGTEILDGLVQFSKSLGLKKIIAEVIIDNKASFNILKKAGFVIKDQRICEDTQLQEYLMQLEL